MKDIIQFDDFAQDAAEVREDVIKAGFSSEIGPDGALYTGISKLQATHWFDEMSDRLGARIIPKLSCFRLNLGGELPHSWVHSDDICARYATVLYLNPAEQCSGGTAFWAHKELGIDRLPSGDLPLGYHRWMTAEWKIKESWEQVGFVPMQWNRLITYPTGLFHSRYPFEAFGSGPEDGRLIWICFYDKEGEQ